MVTTKCSSCGETVLSTDKFCKQCGKPIEQKAQYKSEYETIPENPNKKLLLTFDALMQSNPNCLYSIEVDGVFIGKLKSGEKLEIFVKRGIYYVTLKLDFSTVTYHNYILDRLFKAKELEILLENNQIVLLMCDKKWGALKYNIADTSTQELKRKELKKTKIDKKEKRIVIMKSIVFTIITLSSIALALGILILLFLLFGF